MPARDERVIDFRPLTPADLPMLHEWLQRPHVAAWWQPTPTLEELAEEHAPAFAGVAYHAPYVVLLDGAPAGYVQSYDAVASHADGWWLDEHDPGVRGIDQFIADESLLGRGLGSCMVRRFVELLFRDPAVTRIQTDPDPRNARAIRCYEKAGFRAHGIVETPDGPALVMYLTR